MKEFKFVIDGHEYKTTVSELDNNLAEVIVNGTAFQVQYIKEEKQAAPVIRRSAQSIAPAAAPAVASGTQVVNAPLPGSIIKVRVEAGDKVSVGDELLTMESMKMENSIKSEYSGIIKNVFVAAGQNVMQDDKLIEIETVASAPQPKAAPAPQPKAAPAPQPKAAPAPQPAPAAAPAGGNKVTSPLPGSVIKVVVAQGQAVKKGDLLVVLESMKMENNIVSEYDGTVTSIAVSAGQNIMQEDLLLTIG